MASTTSKIITYEEYLEMPETDAREEVVDGEIISMPANKWYHHETVTELHNMLYGQLDRRLVRIAISSFGLVIRKTPLLVRTPDLAVFIRTDVVEVDGYIHSAPELAVEVLSPSNTRREMARQAEDYASIGVPEVWILSGEARTLEVLQLQDGKLRTIQIVNSGQLRPLRFPETAVDVASVWPD